MEANRMWRLVAVALAIAAPAAIVAPRVATANQVTINENIVCDGFDCADSYQLKCAQSARYLCVVIDGRPSGEDASFVMGTVEIAPKAGAGRGFMRFAFNAAKAHCIARPDNLPEGGITALASVAANFSAASPTPYKLQAECISWATGSMVSRKTTVTKKQDH